MTITTLRNSEKKMDWLGTPQRHCNRLPGKLKSHHENAEEIEMHGRNTVGCQLGVE